MKQLQSFHLSLMADHKAQHFLAGLLQYSCCLVRLSTARLAGCSPKSTQSTVVLALPYMQKNFQECRPLICKEEFLTPGCAEKKCREGAGLSVKGKLACQREDHAWTQMIPSMQAGSSCLWWWATPPLHVHFSTGSKARAARKKGWMNKIPSHTARQSPFARETFLV